MIKFARANFRLTITLKSNFPEPASLASTMKYVGTEALTPRESDTPGPSIFILSNSNFGRTLSLKGL